MNTDSPEYLTSRLHPINNSGYVVLERKINPRVRAKSRLRPNQLFTEAKSAWDNADMHLSTANFSGYPYIPFFNYINALFCVFRIDLTAESLDEKMQRIKWCLQKHQIPFPSAIVADGEQLTYFWVVDKQFEQKDLAVWYLCQQALIDTLHKFQVTNDSLDLTHKIRLIGTKNLTTNKYVRAELPFQGTHRREHLVSSLLSLTTADKLNEINRRASLFWALVKLLEIRWWTKYETQELFIDWFLFLGVSLSHLCSQQCLARELRLLASLIEDNKWSIIHNKYTDYVQAICRYKTSNHFTLHQTSIDVKAPNWENIIFNRLSVTEDELVSISSESPNLIEQPRFPRPNNLDFINFHLEDDTYIPLSRLFLKLAS